MPPELSQSVRRQILADLGIDVWRYRTGPREPVVAAPAARGRAPARPDAGVAPRAGIRAGVAADRRSSPVAPNDPAGSGASRATQFVVVALSVPGVTLLLGSPPGSRGLRLARDLLAAASARWTVEPGERRFDWPPAPELAVAAGPDAARRALNAFVEKTLADHDAAVVLVSDRVAQRLGDVVPGVVSLVVPELDVLAVDVSAKRRVWTLLAARLGGGVARPATAASELADSDRRA